MSKRTSGTTVFIVDDDESVRTGLSRLMRANGYEPRVFGSVGIFLDAYELLDAPSGCILIDMTMPGLSGVQLKQCLADSDVRLPIIVVSALVSAAAQDQARQFGARMFLHKPVDSQALLDAIAWVTGPAPEL